MAPSPTNHGPTLCLSPESVSRLLDVIHSFVERYKERGNGYPSRHQVIDHLLFDQELKTFKATMEGSPDENNYPIHDAFEWLIESALGNEYFSLLAQTSPAQPVQMSHVNDVVAGLTFKRDNPRVDTSRSILDIRTNIRYNDLRAMVNEFTPPDLQRTKYSGWHPEVQEEHIQNVLQSDGVPEHTRDRLESLDQVTDEWIAFRWLIKYFVNQNRTKANRRDKNRREALGRNSDENDNEVIEINSSDVEPTRVRRTVPGATVVPISSDSEGDDSDVVTPVRRRVTRARRGVSTRAAASTNHRPLISTRSAPAPRSAASDTPGTTRPRASPRSAPAPQTEQHDTPLPNRRSRAAPRSGARDNASGIDNGHLAPPPRDSAWSLSKHKHMRIASARSASPGSAVPEYRERSPRQRSPRHNSPLLRSPRRRTAGGHIHAPSRGTRAVLPHKRRASPENDRGSGRGHRRRSTIEVRFPAAPRRDDRRRRIEDSSSPEPNRGGGYAIERGRHNEDHAQSGRHGSEYSDRAGQRQIHRTNEDQHQGGRNTKVHDAETWEDYDPRPNSPRNTRGEPERRNDLSHDPRSIYASHPLYLPHGQLPDNNHHDGSDPRTAHNKRPEHNTHLEDFAVSRNDRGELDFTRNPYDSQFPPGGPPQPRARDPAYRRDHPRNRGTFTRRYPPPRGPPPSPPHRRYHRACTNADPAPYRFPAVNKQTASFNQNAVDRVIDDLLAECGLVVSGEKVEELREEMRDMWIQIVMMEAGEEGYARMRMGTLVRKWMMQQGGECEREFKKEVKEEMKEEEMNEEGN